MILVATLDQMKVSYLSLCGEIMKKMTCYVLILHVNQFKHQAFFPLYDAVSDKVWYGQFLYVGAISLLC